MERLFYSELLKWKEKPNKPLMIVGARQIGKTYLITEFCRKEFQDYIYINLKDRLDLVEFFKNKISFEEMVSTFKLIINRDITENTVLFFDEVQESEELISYLKSFCEADFPYKIICCGSLLGVKLKRYHSSFPVGKVTIKNMYQLTFEEFLINTWSKEIVDKIKDCYENNKKMDDILHERLLREYRIYECIGGMPESVNNYIESNKDIMKLDKNILETIIRSYIADMNKYVLYDSEKVKIENVYNSIPSQLGKENKKFQYSQINSNARKREYESSLEWLLSSKLIIPCYSISECQTPVKASMKEDCFKLYLNDIGLLTRLVNLPSSDLILDTEFRYKGALAENFVASQLEAKDIELFYYQDKNSEIDLIIESQKYGVIPIEVKAGKNKKSISFNKLLEDKNIKLGIRISTNNFGIDGKIKSIPLYAAFCIE